MEQEVENIEEVQQEETTQSVDETKFESAGNDEVIKVDLSKPPVTEENEKPEKTEEVAGSATQLTFREVNDDAAPTTLVIGAFDNASNDIILTGCYFV